MILPLVFVATLFAQAAPIEVGRDSTKLFAFDFSGLKADGSAGSVVSSVEFQFTPTGGGRDYNVTVPIVAAIGTNKIPVKDVLKEVPAGVYDLRARFLGQGGQVSIYSDPLSAPILVVVNLPSKPTNLRVVDS